MSEKKRSSRLEYLRKTTPEDIKIYVDKSYAILNRIYDILEEKGLEQKDLADSLNKYESEISKWLKGRHNFTIQTIAKIEAILGEDIITIPSRKEKRIKIEYFQKYLSNIFVHELSSEPVMLPYVKQKKKLPCENQWSTDLIYYNSFIGYANSRKDKEAYEKIWAD